ncbi:hypothetical protein ACH5RR_012914 [Cinchona calisaya]|uniref:Uncharacterized protein n=1 Tax=Cinchona calisaya TaxID=153742 RepID=A0ABD3AEY5_9GENT
MQHSATNKDVVKESSSPTTEIGDVAAIRVQNSFNMLEDLEKCNLPVAVRKLSVNEKNIHDAADRAKKKRMSHFSKFSHLPSFVRRGAKMVNARMVELGNKTLRRAVPL